MGTMPRGNPGGGGGGLLKKKVSPLLHSLQLGLPRIPFGGDLSPGSDDPLPTEVALQFY